MIEIFYCPVLIKEQLTEIVVACGPRVGGIHIIARFVVALKNFMFESQSITHVRHFGINRNTERVGYAIESDFVWLEEADQVSNSYSA